MFLLQDVFINFLRFIKSNMIYKTAYLSDIIKIKVNIIVRHVVKGIQIKLVPYDACMWRGDTQEGLGSYFHALPAAKGLKVCLLVVFDPTEMPYICQRQGDPTGTPLLQSYQNDVILVLTHLTLYFPFSQLLPQYFPLFTSLNLFFAVPLFSLSWCPPRAVTYCSPGNHHQ